MREESAGDRNEVGVEEWRREGWTRYAEERLNCAKVKQAERKKESEREREREREREGAGERERIKMKQSSTVTFANVYFIITGM